MYNVVRGLAALNTCVYLETRIHTDFESILTLRVQYCTCINVFGALTTVVEHVEKLERTVLIFIALH